MHSNISLGIECGSGRRRGLRAASLLFVAAPRVHLADLGARPAAAVGLMAADLLILVGSSAGASIMTRTLPEDEAPAFRSAGSVAAGSGQGRRNGSGSQGGPHESSRRARTER